MAAPRDLPGLYYDPVKKKYFPLSMKPKSPAVLLPVTPIDDTSRLPGEPISRMLQRQQSTRLYRTTGHTHLLKAGYWSRSAVSATDPDIALLPMLHGVSASVLGVIPDESATGIAFALGTVDGAVMVSRPSRTSRRHWNAVHYLQSRVSAIASHDSSWIATSFGSPSEVYFSAASVDGSTDSMRTVALSVAPRHIQDVRTATFSGRTVALGGRNGVVCVDADVGLGASYRLGSDVLSLDEAPNELVAGARDGTVKIFDTRLPPTQHSPDVLLGRLSRLRTSTAGVKVVGSTLVVSSLAGHLEIYDLRFLRRKLGDPNDAEPISILRGHVCSYAMNLPLAVTPDSNFILAAGQDRLVRMWSLRTGACVSSPLFGEYVFSKPIVGLHVDSHDGIWVCTEDRLQVFR